MQLQRQRGVAVITALLLTTLAVTIVASLFWQQQVQVRSMENQRLQLQTKWILRGAMDWATLVLRQDAVDHPLYTSLDQVWATPLAETRLDQYIERERVEGEVFDATLSGSIIDATSRYNLTNLADHRVIKPEQVAIYRRLLQNLRLDASLAERTAQAVRDSQIPAVKSDMTGTGGVSEAPAPPPTQMPMALTQPEDLLSIPGYTIEIVNKLRDFVIVLPEQSVVNVNTAPAEVLAAIVDNFSVGEANALIAQRKQLQFRTKDIFKSLLNGRTPDETTYDVVSSYFLVRSKVRLDRAALNAEALIHRAMGGPGKQTEVVWVRQN
jgi:general secretion pathway protein K